MHTIGRCGETQNVAITVLVDNRADLIVPSHCTGFRAMSRFASQMPEEFVPGVVGATYLF